MVCMATADAQRRWRANRGARTGQPGRPVVSPCGTQAAYKRHLRHAETPCNLCRIVASAEQRRRRSWEQLERPERFSLLLHRIVLAKLLADPDAVIQSAQHHLAATADRTARGHEAQLAARWRSLLDGPTEDLVGVLVGVDEESIHLRSSTPFVGLATADERATALARSKVA